MDDSSEPPQDESYDEAPFHGSLPPDHPMLQQAQDKLKEQLLATKQRLEEELRERQYAIKAAQEIRLNLGVELYGFQQQLAQLQKKLEETESKTAQLAAEWVREEPELMRLRQQEIEDVKELEAQRAEVEAFREVLNNTSNDLRLLQQHVVEQKGNILVQKGVSQATEKSVRSAASAEEEQVGIIAKLDSQIAAECAKHVAILARHAEQEGKGLKARNTLTEVKKNVDKVQSENRKRSQQWNANLLKLQKLDAKVKETELKIQECKQQQKEVQAEIRACRKESQAAANRADKASLELQRVQGENEVEQQKAENLDQQDAALKVTLQRFEESLASTESALKAAQAESKALAKQQQDMEKDIRAAKDDILASKRELLQQLSSRAALDSTAQDTNKQIAAVKAKTAKLQGEIEAIQQSVTAVEVETAKVEASNASQAATLKEEEAKLKEKEKEVQAVQAALDKQMRDVEKKGRELDALNRKYQKVMAAVPVGEDAGPLEATINNLKRALSARTKELEEHKAAWLNQQSEMHAQSEAGAKASEKLALLKSTRVVVEQRYARLERQRQAVQKDIKDLTTDIFEQRNDIARLNSMLADGRVTKAALEEDVFTLQSKSDHATKDGDAETKRLIKQADDLKAEKERILAEIIKTQRRIKEGERNVQLEKEMQLALHPEHGQAESAALKKENERLDLRLSELHATQKRLQTELSNALAKRETSVVKGRAIERLAEDRKGPSCMEYKKRQMLAALETNVKEMEKDIEEAKAKAEALKGEHAELKRQCDVVSQHCEELKQAQEQDAAEIAQLTEHRCQELIFTARAQRKLKLYKEAEAGKLKISENVERQLNRAKNKHDKLWTILQGIAESNPECSQKIQKALMHHIYMCAEDPDENTNSNVQGKGSDGSAQSGRKALIAEENSDNTDTINDA